MRYDRVSELLELLPHNDMTTINERFFELVGERSEGVDPYEVRWSAYDKLTKGEN